MSGGRARRAALLGLALGLGLGGCASAAFGPAGARELVTGVVTTPCCSSRLRIEAMSASYPEVEVEARGLSSSGLRLLRKPFEMEELIDTLQNS